MKYKNIGLLAYTGMRKSILNVVDGCFNLKF